MQPAMSEHYQSRLAQARALTEVMLDGLLGTEPQGLEITRPERLRAAMRYAALGAGKRLRPFLVMESARVMSAQSGVTPDGDIVRVAAALECVHCYSLVHDDLPAMDDDDLRRGRPTVHRAFDEATAILAGDGLLTLAFGVLADPATHPDGDVRSSLSASLAAASGLGGMAGGQMIDLASEKLSLPESDIRTLQAMKTGALFSYACRAGAIWADAPASDQELLAKFGSLLGLAFQIADDLIDVDTSTESAGKQTGKDAARGKATLVALHGENGARKILEDVISEATGLLETSGEAAIGLIEAIRSLRG
jgi:farnesyl diphosphate synthase